MAIDVEAYYRKYGPMVLRRCRSILRNEEKAVDAMQEVFVQVLRRKDTLKDDAPSSLLYTIATNTCLNMLRKDKRQSEKDIEDVLAFVPDGNDPAEKAVHSAVLDELFSDEKDSTRTIAYLHFVDGMTLEETASAVGMSVSGIRKRLRKLREKGLSIGEDL